MYHMALGMKLEILCAVPKGSILGHILLNIFMCDLVPTLRNIELVVQNAATWHTFNQSHRKKNLSFLYTPF